MRRQFTLPRRRPDRGLDWRVLRDVEPVALVCDCDPPRPQRLGGIWFALNLYQCRTCARKVVS